MTKEEIRLDLVNLCHRPDKSPDKVLEVVRAYERYILDLPVEVKLEPEVEKGKPGPRTKKAGNPDLH